MTRPVEEIRRESERDRAQLARTVGELRNKITETTDVIKHRISSAGIKEEVSGYIAGQSRNWVDALKRQAMENPMQTVAAGMAVAVPALKLVRSVPLPMLLIGAGLALTSKRMQTSLRAALPLDEGRAVADSVVEAATDRVSSVRDQAQTAAGHARNLISDTTDDMRETVSGIASQAKERAGSLRDIAQDTILSGIESATTGAKEAAAAARQTVAGLASDSQGSMQRFARENAVIVGAIGLAFGAIMAAAVPATRVERKSLGQASNKAREMAAEATEAGFDRARGTVMAAVDEVGQRISDADISSEVSRMTENAANNLKSVTDQAVTTAFEPSHNNH